MQSHVVSMADSVTERARSAETFLEQPTTERLAESLEAIAASSTPAAWRGLASLVPWPLGVLLAHAATTADLKRRIADVRDGRHGGPERWTAAERRWASEGVDLDRDRGGSALPFPLEVASFGDTQRASEGIAVPLLSELRALADRSPHAISAAGSRQASASPPTRIAPAAKPTD